MPDPEPSPAVEMALTPEEPEPGHAGKHHPGSRSDPGSRSVAPRSHIKMSKIDPKLRRVLEQYDTNHDGEITRPELEGVINHLVMERFRNRVMLYMVLGMSLYLLILLGSIFGLTWAVVYAHSETAVSGNTLVGRGSSEPLQLASTDYLLSGKGLAARSPSDPAAASSLALTASLAVKMPLHADLPSADLAKVRKVVVQSMRLGAQPSVTLGVGLAVRAASRNPSASAAAPMQLHTSSGLLELRGGLWYVAGTPGPLLEGGALLGAAADGRAPLQGAASGEVLMVYGVADDEASAASLATQQPCAGANVTAVSCSAAFTACGGAASTWAAFATTNFALCERVAYEQLYDDYVFCC